MARIDWVQRRLENWARWYDRMHSGGLGFASQAAFLTEAVDCDRSNEAHIPVDEVEASVTNDAVEALKLGYGHLHQTLRLYYIKGQGIKQTARTMRRAESTIKAQLAQADGLLAVWFTERKRQQEARSAEFRARQDAARPAKLQGVELPPLLAPVSRGKPVRSKLKLRSFTS